MEQKPPCPTKSMMKSSKGKNAQEFTLAVIRSSETTIKCYGGVSKSQTRPVDE